LVSVFVFSGAFMFVPVHERMRGDRLKPAMAAQFFLAARSQWRARKKSRHAQKRGGSLSNAAVLVGGRL
jgi:hypothetical protein